MPKQERSDERAGRRFKRRRKRRRGKRGAVSERRGRDKSVEGKDRQFRDRGKEKRPGDRKQFKRSGNRSPKRRQRRQGGDRDKRDFKPQTGRPGDQRGPARQALGGIRDEINQIKQRREAFSQRRPEQVAADRGFDPERLKGLPGAEMPPQVPATQPVIGPDGRVAPTAPQDGRVAPQQQPGQQGIMPAPAPVQQPVTAQLPDPAPQPGVFDGVDYGVDQVGGSPDVIGPAAGGPAAQGVGQQMQDLGFTPADAPGPTAPPGVATDAYGKPAQPGSGPYAPQLPPQVPQPQMNPRAAGMDRFAQPPPQRRPEDLARGPAPV